MSVPPSEDLQRQAAEQRRQMHETATELKEKIAAARDKLDIKKNARQRFWSAATIVTAVGALFGYILAGAFTRR